MRKISLHWKILIGMALGVLFGFILSNLNGGGIFISNWIKPFGTIFINSLKLIAIPLILASLIKGISDLKDISKLSSMGGVTILTYLSTTVIAVSVGLLLVNIIKPGDSITEKTRTELIEAYDSDAEEKRMAAAENKDEKKAELLQNYRDKFANPFVAAEKGFLDDVIKPSETRDLILKSLNMLENKTDQNIPKKHGNIPL